MTVQSSALSEVTVKCTGTVVRGTVKALRPQSLALDLAYDKDFKAVSR